MTDGETEGGQENISDSPLVIELVNSKAGTDFRYFYAWSIYYVHYFLLTFQLPKCIFEGKTTRE